MKTPANDNHTIRSEGERVRWKTRLIFVLGTTTALFVLRLVDPVIAGHWVPLHTSCGAITGLPCIFCGMTRALHALLNGDFAGAVYFNWLAFPFLGVVVFFAVVCVIEIPSRCVILRWNTGAPITVRKLTIIGLSLFTLWLLQVYLAASQHKDELFNARGPLYGLFVR